MKKPIIAILACFAISSNAFTPPSPFLARKSYPQTTPTSLNEAAEPKILLKAPELPREEDGKVHVPVIPAFAGFLAVAAAGIAKTRENRMAKQVAREENSAQLLENVKAYNAAKKQK